MKKTLFIILIFLMTGCFSRNVLDVPLKGTGHSQKLSIEKTWVENLSPGEVIIHGNLQNRTYSYIPPLKIKFLMRGANDEIFAEKIVDVKIPFRRLIGKRKRSWKRSYRHFEITMPFAPDVKEIELFVFSENQSFSDSLSKILFACLPIYQSKSLPNFSLH